MRNFGRDFGGTFAGETHDGPTKAQSGALNARLILILMSLAVDAEVIRATMETAKPERS